MSSWRTSRHVAPIRTAVVDLSTAGVGFSYRTVLNFLIYELGFVEVSQRDDGPPQVVGTCNIFGDVLGHDVLWVYDLTSSR